MSDWSLPERFEVGDGTVRWNAFGDGPPLVLLHGTPFSSYIWRDVVPVLARDHRVYVWDMLGFGQSTRAALDVSLRRQTTIFVALLEHWGVSGLGLWRTTSAARSHCGRHSCTTSPSSRSPSLMPPR
ncbi:alpha/beta fold hydrolase [Sphingomonas sp. LR61]|uniref:alpha/beta fold hydrolase n=1 Tax=Sphingomonas sp. LR61 TaxID=3050234 RepID=UPI003FA77BF1